MTKLSNNCMANVRGFQFRAPYHTPGVAFELPLPLVDLETIFSCFAKMVKNDCGFLHGFCLALSRISFGAKKKRLSYRRIPNLRYEFPIPDPKGLEPSEEGAPKPRYQFIFRHGKMVLVSLAKEAAMWEREEFIDQFMIDVAKNMASKSFQEGSASNGDVSQVADQERHYQETSVHVQEISAIRSSQGSSVDNSKTHVKGCLHEKSESRKVGKKVRFFDEVVAPIIDMDDISEASNTFGQPTMSRVTLDSKNESSEMMTESDGVLTREDLSVEQIGSVLHSSESQIDREVEDNNDAKFDTTTKNVHGSDRNTNLEFPDGPKTRFVSESMNIFSGRRDPRNAIIHGSIRHSASAPAELTVSGTLQNEDGKVLNRKKRAVGSDQIVLNTAPRDVKSRLENDPDVAVNVEPILKTPCWSLLFCFRKRHFD